MLPEDFGDGDKGEVLQLVGAALRVPGLVLKVQLLRQRPFQVLTAAGSLIRYDGSGSSEATFYWKEEAWDSIEYPELKNRGTGESLTGSLVALCVKFKNISCVSGENIQILNFLLFYFLDSD